MDILKQASSHEIYNMNQRQTRTDVQILPPNQCLKLERQPTKLESGENFGNRAAPLRMSRVRRKVNGENITCLLEGTTVKPKNEGNIHF